MASISARRLAKELREIQAEGCPVGEPCVLLLPLPLLSTYLGFYSGITLLEANDFTRWLFTIEVMGDSLYQVCSEHLFHCYHVLIMKPSSYQGEIYTLQFRFDAQYPISSPAVQFVVTGGKESPIHPVRLSLTTLVSV